MYRLNRERLKTYGLIILFFISILQVGILWAYQNHGFPTSFLLGFSNGQKTSLSENSEQYFKPFRIIASSGDESHWIIDEKSAAYNQVWNDVKNFYLEAILNTKPADSYPLTDEAWGDLVSKKAFILDFRTYISTELLVRFLHIKNPPYKEPGGIYKMAMLPWEDINNNLTVYINDGARIYKYILPFQGNASSKMEGYEDIFTAMRQDAANIDYSIKSEADPSNKGHYPISGDVLFIAKGPKYSEFKQVECLAPEAFTVRDPGRTTELDKLAGIILAGDKSLYDYAPNTSGAIVFKNLSNLYRVYGDGLLEYKYLSASEEVDRGSLADAMEKAADFVEKRKQLVSGAAIYLSGINTGEKGYYEFTFDYLVMGKPVYFDYKIKSADTANPVVLHNAITVRVNGRRVINAWWVVKRFEPGRDVRLNVRFDNLLKNAHMGNIILKDEKDSLINDISIAYKIDGYSEKAVLEPVWVIAEDSGKSCAIPMD